MALLDQPIRLTYVLRFHRQTYVLQAFENGIALSEREVKAKFTKLHPLDAAIVREMRQAATMFAHLSDQQIARILSLLLQRQATYNQQRLTLIDEPLTPRLKIERMTREGIYVTLGLADAHDELFFALSEGRLLAGSQAYFLHGPKVYPITSRTPWELGKFAQVETHLLSSSWTPAERQKWLENLIKAGVPEKDIEALLLRKGPPQQFILQWLTFDDETLQVKLFADYEGTRVPVEPSRTLMQYVTVGDKDNIQGMIERDWPSEESARQILQQEGFRFDKETNMYLAKGEVALNMLNIQWPEDWRIEKMIELPNFRSDLVLVPQVRWLQNEGLLDVQIDIHSDNVKADALIGMRELLAWLHSGKKYLRLNDGTFVAPSDDFKKSLWALDDLGAESDRLLVSPLCIGLLKAIGHQAGLKAADELTQAWLKELLETKGPKPVEPPSALAAILRDYQRHGLDWLMMLHRHRLTGILADDMGLGKTLQTLALLSTVDELEGKKMSLVVAPTSVINVWYDECLKFLPDFKVVLWHGPPKLRHAIDLTGVDLLITSYSILRRDTELLKEHPFRYVILDEAQSAKNASSQNAQAVRQLKSEHRLALTGTPIENRLEELWATFDFLAPGFLGTLSRFRKRYDDGSEQGHFLLRERVTPLILRRMKSDVIKELPPKIESVVRCDMEPAQRALYEHVAGTLRQNVLEKIKQVGIESAQLDILAALTRLRQICCDPSLLKTEEENLEVPPSAKLQLFEELMREALDSNRKVVVFSQFVQMQKLLIGVIKKLGVNPLWLHGGTQKRDKVVADFQDEQGPPVIVVSLRAGGAGITLSRADTVFLYEPWWNPAVEKQATDRAHRMGQKNQVTVYRLICANTIEERVLELAKTKDALAESLLGTEGKQAKQLRVEDVLALLQ